MQDPSANHWNQQQAQYSTDVDQTHKSRAEVVHRPPNAFILYSQERRSSVQAENPALSNIEISRLLGKMWKEVPSSSKLLYKQKAQMLQEEFKQKHPDYTYVKARRKRALNELLTKSTQNYGGVLGFPQMDPSNLAGYQLGMQQLYQQQMAPGFQMQSSIPHQQTQQNFGQYQTNQPYNVQQQYVFPPPGFQLQH